MRTFRFALAIFAVLWLIPAPIVLGHTSANGVIFGGYTISYFAAIIVYFSVAIAVLATAALAKSGLRDHVFLVVRWLQKRWLLIIVLAYALYELWWFVYRYLGNSGFYGWKKSDYQNLLIALGILFAWGILFLIFAGRDAESRRSIAANLGLLVGSTLFSFAVFSLVFALFITRSEYFRVHTIWGSLIEVDRTYGTVNASNHDGMMYFPELDELIPVTTNAAGIRGKDTNTDARVAGIGDSFIFGLWVEDAEVWSTLLSERFGEPVVNYGVTGWQFPQYTMLMDQEIAVHDYDLVIYGLFNNDLYVQTYDTAPPDRETYQQIRRYFANWRNPFAYTFYHVIEQGTPSQRIIEAIRNRGVVISEDSDAIAQAEVQIQPEDINAPFEQPLACGSSVLYEERMNSVIMQYIDRALELADRDGYTLLVVPIPTREMVYLEDFREHCSPGDTAQVELELAMYSAICERAAEYNQPCYDITADLRASADELGDVLYYYSDGHWNLQGHIAFANLLGDYIETHKLLD